MFRRPSLLAAAIGTAAVFVGGCSVSFSSGGDTIKKDDLVKDVQNFMTAQLPDLPPTKSVDCPGDVDTKVGTTFECTAVLTNGQQVTIPLQVKTSGGSHGTIQSNPKIVDSALAVDLLYRGAAGPIKSGQCPTGIPAKVGKTFACKVVFANGATYTVTLRVDSASPDGNQHLTRISAKKT